MAILCWAAKNSLRGTIVTQNFSKKIEFEIEEMCLRVSYKKKYEENFFFLASLKSLRKVVGSGVGSGSVSQRYGSAPKCHKSPTLVV